ncbi:MAG TPA: ATP-dependent helicase [Thermoanaerobaculia bacterium]|nr:ATP-dependent helicase [Thermoanaerobaculia bacterium]
MTTDELLQLLFPTGAPYSLTPDQQAVVRHRRGPAWVLAGPGSGKTEVLSLLALRLLFCDDNDDGHRIAPESLIVTTFTEKAARNIDDRIRRYRDQIVAAQPDLAAVDLSRLRIGTLHSLCNDLLQECRAPNYQNVRLMDEFEQAMFVYEHVSSDPLAERRDLWATFSYLFARHEWQPTYNYAPSRWNRAEALTDIFNRIVDDRVSVPAMHARGGNWQLIAQLYDKYAAAMQTEFRCDFAHLQLRFLEFLGTPLGQVFREGGGGHSGITWVLVDEYQDTNLLQEEIYLTLAHAEPSSIVVVGDDDQALYRFRGGSVECMVTFDAACRTYLAGTPTVSRYPLVDNFRSHPKIVEFCSNYIEAFPATRLPGARVPNKPRLRAHSSISGNYQAVGVLSGTNINHLSTRVAQTIRDLRDHDIIHDYNQACILLASTRESPQNALPYVTALRAAGIDVYNPRNKAFVQQEEVSALLGALSSLLDPNGASIPPRPPGVAALINECRAAYDVVAVQHPGLRQYIERAVGIFRQRPGQYVESRIQEIIYYLLSLDPFAAWQNDPIRRIRLGRLTSIFEAFASTPVPNRPNVFRGNLRTDEGGSGAMNNLWLLGFYHLLFGYLSRVGVDDVEEEVVGAPPGMLPVMTIHQAKGLEFPFVFVGHLNRAGQISASHQLETALSQFPTRPERAFQRPPEQTRAELDVIRQYFVAYSRAQNALILMGTTAHLRAGRPPCGPNRQWLPNQALPL